MRTTIPSNVSKPTSKTKLNKLAPSKKEWSEEQERFYYELIDLFIDYLKVTYKYTNFLGSEGNSKAQIHCGVNGYVRSAEGMLKPAFKAFWEHHKGFYDKGYRWAANRDFEYILGELETALDEEMRPVRGEHTLDTVSRLIPIPYMPNFYKVNTWRPFIISRPEADPFSPPAEYEPFSCWDDFEEWEAYVITYRNADAWLTEYFARLLPDDGQRKLFIQWLAHMIQFPDVKQTWHFVLPSDTGTGKGFLFHRILKQLLVGQAVQVKTYAQITGKHSAVHVDNMFVMVDDAKATEGQTLQLKSTVTEEELLVERKFRDESYCPSFCRYLCASNEEIPLALEANDRRWYVVDYVEHKVDLDETQEFLGKFETWINGDKSYAYCCFWRWFNQIDLSDYNPKRMPKNTAAKERIIEDSVGDLVEFMSWFLEEWEGDVMREDNAKSRYRGGKWIKADFVSAMTAAQWEKVKVQTKGKGTKPTYWRRKGAFSTQAESDAVVLDYLTRPIK